MTALDLLDDLNATTPLSVRVCLSYKCPSKVHLPLCLQKHAGDSYGSRLSSESDLVSSEQGEDEGRYVDDRRSAELEEWHGFQNTTFDSANHDKGSEPGPSSDSRPVLAKSSSGTSRPSVGYIYLT
jgi:hypothetical protein